MVNFLAALTTAMLLITNSGWAGMPLPTDRGHDSSNLILIQDGSGSRFQIISEFHQPAAPNVEKSDIAVIRCQNREYYIYRYYRSSGPNYRAIIPGRWGNALGGGDHWSFDDAARAACNW